MTTTTLIAIAVVLIVLIAAVWVYVDRQRRLHLKTRFGPEYERAVRDTGDPRRAESLLETRARRVSKYEIHPLTSDQSRRFTEEWRRVQARFVDDPAAAVTDGDRLVTEVMNARGYPMTDFDRRAEDLSVDHSNVIHHYREARAIAEKHARKSASTEDLRQALVHYRALFEDLLEVHEPERRRA